MNAKNQLPAPGGESVDTVARPSKVSGVTYRRMPRFKDARGMLSVGEFDRDLPFLPKRYFLVFDVPGADVRGEHAHRQCHQLLLCVNGSMSVLVDDGHAREEFLLDRPDAGLHIPPMVWASQHGHSPGAVLLVFASDHYAADDYIRNYEEFLRTIRPA